MKDDREIYVPAIDRRTNNMNAMRYVMALSVVVLHTVYVSGIPVPFNPGSVTIYTIGGFFALSGFLIFGSYLHIPSGRGRLSRYLAGRARRILPSYFFIVLLSAIGFSLVSTFTIREYFTSPSLYKYLAANLSFLNFLWPSLPGVFDGVAVNGSLWTMKIEWMLYLSVPVVCAICRRNVRHTGVILAVIIFLSICWRVIFLHIYDDTGKEIYYIMSRQVGGQFVYFYTGAMMRVFWHWFDRWKVIIAIICVPLCIVAEPIAILRVTIGPIAFSAAVITLSFIGKWGSFCSPTENISYQIYLFHLPILWLMKYFGWFDTLGLTGALIVGIVLSAVLAEFSWRFIDRPIASVSHKKKGKLLHR